MTNKYFFSTYHSDPETRVIIVLVKEKVYTVVSKQVMSEKGLFRGCFIGYETDETLEQLVAHAFGYIDQIGARYVSLDEFNAIEKAGEAEWTAKAFATAERMIANG